MGDPVTSSSRRVFTGTPWEQVVSYCRAIERGGVVAVSGTVSVRDGALVGAGDPAAQVSCCLEIIERALRELGLSRVDIVRTRLFVTDISRWKEYGRAHGEFFRGHEPATSMVEVSALIAPEYLVEIEADAVRGGVK